MIDTKLMSMRTSLEYKRLSCGFVLAALMTTNAQTALADDLPPPPPPPPGANPLPPAAPVGTGVLDAPPPPPPGVKVEPVPPPAPTNTTPPPPPPAPTSTVPGLAAPPPPPPGVTPEPEALKPPRTRPRAPRQTATMPEYSSPTNTTPAYRWKEPASAGVKWYGWQSLLGVVPSQAMLFGGLYDWNSTLVIVGGLGSLIMSPIVHRGNGQSGKGWASFAGNAGAMLIGGLIGEEVGFTTALVVWTALDISLLHYKPTPVEEPKKSALGIQSWAIVPMMENGRKGLSVVGQF